MKYLEVCLQTSIFAPLFNRKRISLDYGVMVAQQVLVLFVQVRILVVQQSSSLEDTKPRKSKCFAGFFVAFSEFFTTAYTDSHRFTQIKFNVLIIKSYNGTV